MILYKQDRVTRTSHTVLVYDLKYFRLSMKQPEWMTMTNWREAIPMEYLWGEDEFNQTTSRFFR